MPTKKQHLSTLWVGGPLSRIERLCLASMVDCGHPVALYTYGGVPDAPAGVDLRDAREVMPESKMIREKRTGSLALGSNLFRYRLLQKGWGTCWADCDMLFIKPLPVADYVFGWERPDSINSAVLKLPPDSPVLENILALADSTPVILPWWKRRRRRRERLKAWLGFGRPLEQMPWGTIGPRAVTHFLKAQWIHTLASPIPVFYPNPATLGLDVFDPAANIESRLTDQTIAVHLWNTEIRAAKDEPVRAGCFIDRHCKRLGLNAEGEQAAQPLKSRAGHAGAS
ncbi:MULTISPECIES: galactosyltransferase Lgt5 [Rhodomicrobium]|uniref:galactosyltransferase Lgt5 n=1 Tax=Rhodomicrobium TaxID=1068 RepID=UPI000B4B7B46|nr:MULTISPECIES: galactosyltransferase Lgt5 [Rhodomicrobium]